jgi:hypothetical protein
MLTAVLELKCAVRALVEFGGVVEWFDHLTIKNLKVQSGR